MERADKGLAFMLQYENVAWYEKGEVRILDRRIYPQKTEYVRCHTHEEVALAITDMVTQSAGPYTAAAMGMALAAYECRHQSAGEQRIYLRNAAETISNARPTTKKRMQRICEGCLNCADMALRNGEKELDLVLRDYCVEINNTRYQKVEKMAEHLVQKIPNQGTILTQCFGETIVGQMLKMCRTQGKEVRLFCPETRPFFQGARFTATVCRDMGFDVSVITDNMPAYVMQKEHVDVFTCASDVICCDGYVANKVGTFQISIAANYLGIPVYVTGIPEKDHLTVDSVHVELRNPQETLEAMGQKTAKEGVKGYYPAFDLTPPSLITGIVTDLGIYRPNQLSAYLKDSHIGPYEIII